jgi:hypothetical protein
MSGRTGLPACREQEIRLPGPAKSMSRQVAKAQRKNRKTKPFAFLFLTSSLRTNPFNEAILQGSARTGHLFGNSIALL